MKLASGFVVLGFVCSAALATEPMPRALTFDDRVAAQKAIEQVYWDHRIWPNDNPQPKPSLSTVMSDDSIRAKVEDYLKKSNALETWWQRPITADQLQAELDRMARDSHDPGVLRELFSALGDDPSLIAETLARQTLADRLIRNWYAADQHFTSDARATAEAARAACSSIDCMKSMGGEYAESIRRLQSSGQEGISTLDPDDAVDLDDSAWRDYRDRMAEIVGGEAETLSAGRLSRVTESEYEFFVTAVLSQTDRTISAAHVSWPKRTFESWWESQRPGVGRDVPLAPAKFSLPSVSAAPCVDDTWTPTRIEVPDARTAHTAVWTGAEMIVWGGDSGGGVYNSGGRYNPSTDSWTFTSMGPGVPSARRWHSAVWTGSEMIVWGGEQDQSPVWVNTGGRYNPATDSWAPTSTGTGVPVRRSDHTAVWTGSEMIVWGGYDSVLYKDTGGRYNPATDTWTATSTGANHPSPRRYHTGTWTGTEMVIWGGENPTYLNTGGRYRPSTDTWTATSIDASTPSARMRHSAVWTGTEVIVWGGNNGGNLNSGSRYEPSSNSWKVTSTGQNLPTARYAHTAVWTGSQMIVWGGSSAGPTGGRYDPVGDTWQPTATGANVPSARVLHTAVWTGSEMIIWGGGFIARVSTGGRYSPTTDSWVPTRAAVTVPSERYFSSVVWTGSEAIVWGGADDLGTRKTGSRYVPATDVWVPTAIPATVPTSRYWHSAVWTGTEMIVWGGVTSANKSNVGGRYNPSTDSWTPVSTGANNPSGRSLHTAIWTGTEMIIWGGSFQSSAFDTGGRYNPASNSWAPTSLGANLPSARSRHTAVWTGNEMIIWGGEGGSALNTGGRYDPSLNTWTATSTGTGVPVRRTEHTAVWTGSEMIVWGGYNLGGGIQPTAGGRYAPATDSWTAASTVNAPPIREGPTGLWTGKDMIVWGGFSSTGGVFQPNGRYNPANNTWLSISTTNAPSYRRWHVATWTGTEMFIWGGWPFTMTGGLYCGCPLGQVFYRDADGDGFGDPAVSLPSCDGSAPSGHVLDATDCDDHNASVYPGAAETCNGVDDNCDGASDEGDSALCDDDNGCTDDVCGGAEGCFHAANTNLCDDSNACTTGDTCGGSVCIPGGPTNCDDGNCCTIDSCNSSTGCVYSANTTPPAFTDQPSLGTCPTLWPPNHQYTDFTVGQTGATVSSSCGIASIQFASCSSSQPENGTGTGDGNTTSDCVYEPSTLHLRAERDGACSPIGRVYETRLIAVDVCGNTANSNPINVGVHHDRGTSPTGGTVYSGTINGSVNGTNGTYSIGCGNGNSCVNGTGTDHSDADPEMEISQFAAVSVGDLTVNKESGGNVQLTWTDPTALSTTHVTRYHVWVLDPEILSWTLLAAVDKHTTTYSDPTQIAGIRHDYKVTAVIK